MIDRNTLVPLETIMLFGMPIISFLSAFAAIRVNIDSLKAENTAIRKELDHVRDLLEKLILRETA